MKNLSSQIVVWVAVSSLLGVGSSRAASPVITDPVLTSIGIVTGGDAGEGLDLDGNFVYALSIGADTATFTPQKIRDATFQALAVNEVAGATLQAGNQIPNWYLVTYGDTANDTSLALATSSIRWSDATTTIPQVVLTLTNLEVGAEYKVQLMFGEQCCNRGFDVFFDGRLAVKDFNPGVQQGGIAQGAQEALITQLYFASTNTLVLRLDGRKASSDYSDHNAILNAVTVEKLAGNIDSDNDGLLDAWETLYFGDLSQNGAGDPDNDGLSNAAEYTTGTNPKKADTDGDGLKDGVETGTGTWVSATNTGTNPLNPDSDGDTLKDGVETGTGTFVDVNNTGTNPNLKDTDGDGFADGIEIALGTNPTDKTKTPVKSGSANLLAYWDFNDSSAADKSVDKVHSFAASVDGGAAYTADLGGHSGKAGDRAMDFGADSAGEVLRVSPATWANAAGTVDQMTVTYWEKLADVANSSAFWFVSDTENRGFQAHVPWGDGTIYFDTGTTGGGWTRINTDMTTLDPNFDFTTWHHFAFVKNAKKKQIWIDGKLIMEGNNANPLPTDFTRFTIGAIGDATSSIHGLIDDFAVYASALDSSQIGAIAQGTPPNQLDIDSDGDGMPDVWEVAYGLKPQDASDAGLDPDSDGLTNLQEFQRKTDPKNADTDGDGLKDSVETRTGIWVSATDTGTDPTSADTDGDGLSDSAETATGVFVSATNTGTNPNKADTDGDGFSDAFEISLGTNPNDPSSALAQRGALNLLAYWTFNDATNTDSTVDLISGIRGTFLGATAFTADKGGHTGQAGDLAIDFGADGAGEAVDVTNVTFLNVAGALDQITVSTWEKLVDIDPDTHRPTFTSSSFWGYSTSSGGNRGINVHIPWSDNVIYFDTAGCCGADTRISQNISTLDTNFDWTIWHNYVFVKDGATNKAIYVDGKLLFKGTGSAPFPSDFYELVIGGLNGSGTIHGQEDDFAVWAAALTPAEIGLIAGGTAPNNLPPRTVGPAQPQIQITLGTGKVTLSWSDASFKLQKADKVNGTYNEVTGAASPRDVPTTGSTEAYYRLAK